MGEFIEKRKEKMIHEYEHMKYLKLFTDDEIRDIKNKRFQHENKIERQTKEMVDFVNYIVYEKNMLNLLAERRKKIGKADGKNSLESSILGRIKYLYKKAFDRFPHEYRLWVQYMKYCKQHRFIAEGSKVLDVMLNFHGDKPKAWISSANWEYNETHNMERVKHFMFRGLQKHPECRELYLNFLNIQLSEAENIIKNADENTSVQAMMAQEDSELNKALDCANLLYDHYKKKDHDIDFFIEILQRIEKFDFAKPLAKRIFEDMKKLFPRSEIMWHTLAQLALLGSYLLDENGLRTGPGAATIHMEVDVPIKSENNENVGQETSSISSLKARIEKCIMIYNAAIEVLKNEKICSLYIDAMLELNEDMDSQKKLKRKALGEAFKMSYESGYLTEEKYIQYIKLLINADPLNHEFIEEVIQKATAAHPNSPKVWEYHFIYLVRKDEEHEKIYELFRKATKKLASQSLSLWKLLLQYYHTRPDLPDKVEQTFKEAIKQTPTISFHFQPIYLEYLALTKSIKIARKEYKELVKATSPCLPLHKKMASLESMQMNPDIESWRTCHENTTQLFGKNNTEVWIDYIKFERDNGIPKNMQFICDRAKARLDVELVSHFITEYEFLKKLLV